MLDYFHDKGAFIEELSLIGKNKGELVVEEGDPGDYMFVIIEGEVKVLLKRGKKEIVLATLGRGNFFGEIGSVLKYLIAIFFGIITLLIYYSALPLSILAVVFIFINRNYNKRLPARSLTIISAICWLWLVVVVLLKKFKT